MTVNDLTLSELISLLREAHKESTQGKWQRGRTTHHTMTDKKYHIAEFHHASDASFCDNAHELLPLLLDKLAPVNLRECCHKTVIERCDGCPYGESDNNDLCSNSYDAASDEFFSIRPELDNPMARRIFYAGHRKAWMECTTKETK